MDHRKERQGGQPKKRLTATDIYERLCGELGISRHEFYHELTFHEASLLIRGLERRYRALYENGRMICNCFAGKDLGIKFPWDNSDEDNNHEWTQEELNELLGKE